MLCFWVESEMVWKRVQSDRPLIVDITAPLLLLRRLDTFYIRGLGDAIQFLNKMRASNNLTAIVDIRPATVQEIRAIKVSLSRLDTANTSYTDVHMC